MPILQVRDCILSQFQHNDTLHRQLHATDLSHSVAKFSPNTATGPLCCHLYENHTEAWIADYEQLKIKIKSKEAVNYIQEFRGEAGSADLTQMPAKLIQKRLLWMPLLSGLLVMIRLVFLLSQGPPC